VPTKVTIEKAVRESLDEDPRLRHPAEVAVIYDDGVVTLTGVVSYQFESDAAYDDVAELFGVIGITNEISVVNL
jgi:osmotically-inducible protein OsmY